MLFFPELGNFNSAFIWSLSYFMDEKSFVNSAKAGIHIVPLNIYTFSNRNL